MPMAINQLEITYPQYHPIFYDPWNILERIRHGRKLNLRNIKLGIVKFYKIGSGLKVERKKIYFFRKKRKILE